MMTTFKEIEFVLMKTHEVITIYEDILMTTTHEDEQVKQSKMQKVYDEDFPSNQAK